MTRQSHTNIHPARELDATRSLLALATPRAAPKLT